jgi:hypothetical protein
MTGHKIYPHGGLEEVADGAWIVRGGNSMPLHRNMAVVRVPSGEIVLHSVVALDEDGLRALEALGKPAYAIVPNKGHRMDIAFYAARYPDLKILTPAVHVTELGQKVAVAGSVEDVLPSLGFKLHAVPGIKDMEYVYEWPLASGGRILIANDFLGSANAHDDRQLMGRLVMKHLCAPGNRLDIARIYRFVKVADEAAIRTFVGNLADIPEVTAIIVSHGDPVTADTKGALRHVARV